MIFCGRVGGSRGSPRSKVHAALPFSKESRQPILPTDGAGLAGVVARLIDHLVAPGISRHCVLYWDP